MFPKKQLFRKIPHVAFVRHLPVIFILLSGLTPFIHAQVSFIPDSLESPDSFQLYLQQLKLDEAEIEVNQTNFWHRLIPQIHLSASVGMHDLIFTDPSYNVLTVLPKDAYRVTISMSLTELFDFSKHTLAQLKLEGIKADIIRLRQHWYTTQLRLTKQLQWLEKFKAFISEELIMKKDLLMYSNLRFTQGKIDYEAFVRSKLDILNVNKTLFQLDQHIEELSSQLKDGGS